ncbi:DsbA family protein [Microlunatus soli]|uniref:Protein-disulfide isomerase n=1 Tax=Microlunatus soli TaxID=630515 RepID=A0A1H2A3R6_9ACTN|nr:thioredoxin domain-containing protein [Microlunatus soli]SDT40628.1 Protein-disulfide isomerase [Microlunatus soli]
MPSTRPPSSGGNSSRKNRAGKNLPRNNTARKNQPRPAGATSSARSTQQQARLAEQQADRRRQRLILAAVVVGLVLVVAVAGIGYQAWRTNRSPEAPSAQPTFGPTTISPGKPIVLGEEDAAVTLTLYEDFRCPHCADFTENVGETLTGLQRDGTVKVELYPMSFVDPEHGSRSAANAMACAAEGGRGQQFYAGLFENYGLQWSDQQLIELGTASGLTTPEFGDCVRSMQHRSWIDSITRVAAERKVDQTPTVLINGTIQPKAAEWTPDQVRQAVAAAR